MRCIEMGKNKKPLFADREININMRCIEIYIACYYLAVDGD